MLAHAVLPIVSVLYLNYKYGWDERAVGFLLAAVGVCSMVVQGALIGPSIKRFGERKALIGGLLFGALGFFVYAAAQTGLVFLAGIPLQALWGIANPASNALMSRHVGADEQGQLQGANASISGDRQHDRPGAFLAVVCLGDQAGAWPEPAGHAIRARGAAAAWRVRDCVAGDATLIHQPALHCLYHSGMITLVHGTWPRRSLSQVAQHRGASRAAEAEAAVVRERIPVSGKTGTLAQGRSLDCEIRRFAGAGPTRSLARDELR